MIEQREQIQENPILLRLLGEKHLSTSMSLAILSHLDTRPAASERALLAAAEALWQNQLPSTKDSVVMDRDELFDEEVTIDAWTVAAALLTLLGDEVFSLFIEEKRKAAGIITPHRSTAI